MRKIPLAASNQLKRGRLKHLVGHSRKSKKAIRVTQAMCVPGMRAAAFSQVVAIFKGGWAGCLQRAQLNPPSVAVAQIGGRDGPLSLHSRPGWPNGGLRLIAVLRNSPTPARCRYERPLT